MSNGISPDDVSGAAESPVGAASWADADGGDSAEMSPENPARVGKSTEMIAITDAFASRFPSGSTWARQALASLGVEFGSEVMIHDLAAGWYRPSADSPLIDTLWLLTEDRLGLGQTNAGSGAPRWIPMSAIVAMDAIDESPLPLQTVEIHLAGGLVMCVGWPDDLTESVVAVLTSRLPSDPVPAVAEDAMPPELSDPAVAAGVVDASSLDDLAPSGWVESPVETPSRHEELIEAFFADEGDLSGSDAETESAASSWVNPFDVMDPSVANPVFAPETSHETTPVPFAVGAPERSDGTHSDFAMAPQPGHEHAAAAFGDRPEADTESLRIDDPWAPWNRAGVVWPAALSGITYLGGHPEQPRKRKNGVLAFTPAGLVAGGSGLQSWTLEVPWTEVKGVRIEGTDEVMFTEGVRIEATSSALIAELTDGSSVYFEVRHRRPGSLRSPLAPVLLMVDNIKGYRLTGRR